MNAIPHSSIEAFICHRNAEAPYSRAFVISQRDDVWSIPYASETLSTEGTDIHVRASNGTKVFRYLETDVESGEQSFDASYFLVSYNGLKSVLEFRDDEVNSALELLEPSMLNGDPVHPAAYDASEWSVVVVKPDAVGEDAHTEILEEVEGAGLTIAMAAHSVQLCPSDVGQLWTPPSHYKIPQTPGDWWYATVDYMCEAPVSAYLVHGADASASLLGIKRLLRDRHGKDPHSLSGKPVNERVRSLMHCSDRTEELIRNTALFWRPEVVRQIVRDAA